MAPADSVASPMPPIRENVPAQGPDVARVRADIAELARPRGVGSEGAAEVADRLRARFRALGFDVAELPFSFSTIPGRWGLSLAGLTALASMVGGSLLVLRGHPRAGVFVLLLGLGLVAIAAAFMRAAIDRLRFGRAESTNWLITRPGATPRYLVVAHRDSKSQTTSLFLRASAIVVTAVAWVALVGLALVAALRPGAVWEDGITVLATAGGLAGFALMMSFVRDRSPGALDNATGLAALLAIAASQRDNGDVGYLVTDGEELGLAGAWAVSGELPAVFGAINLDGLDDHGDTRVVERYGVPRRGFAPGLVAALLTAAAELDIVARRGALPIGVLVDQIALADAGIPTVTLMRGTLRSLARVHRPADGIDRLSGVGAAETARLVARALDYLKVRPHAVRDAAAVPRV